MVERPIKKSERQAQVAAGETNGSTAPATGERSQAPRNKDRKGGKGGKGGKRGDREEAPKQAANPALLRGPKPVKPQPVVEEPPVEEETVAETEASVEAEAVAE